MDNLINYSLRKRKSNLPKVSPYISLRDLETFRSGIANLQKAFGDISRNADLASRSFQDTVSAMEQAAQHMGTLSSRFIIEDNLGITMLEMLSAKGPDIITQTKTSPVWENNLSSLIMMRWRCIGRYSFAKGHLMLSQLGIEQLPQWAKLYLHSKSMSYLNPNAKDLLYCWTQTQKNMPSTWLSSLLHIKKSRWCFYQTEKT